MFSLASLESEYDRAKAALDGAREKIASAAWACVDALPFDIDADRKRDMHQMLIEWLTDEVSDEIGELETAAEEASEALGLAEMADQTSHYLTYVRTA